MKRRCTILLLSVLLALGFGCSRPAGEETSSEATATQENVPTGARDEPAEPEEKVKLQASGGAEAWNDPHDENFDGNYQHAAQVDPYRSLEAQIESEGDRDFYKFSTGSASGLLRVRFEQTGPTQINPTIQAIYGSSVRRISQPTKGADVTLEQKLNGKSTLVYIGVWDDRGDAFSDLAYRLSFSFEGEPSLPEADESQVPRRFRLSDVTHFEGEPNDDHWKATPIKLPACLGGRIGAKGDADFFKFALEGLTGKTVDVELQQLDGSPLTPRIRFYDGDRVMRQEYRHQSQGMDLIGKYRINRKDEFSWIEIADTSGEVETNVPYIACLKPGKE